MSDKEIRVREKLKRLVQERCGTPIQSRFDFSDVVQEGLLQLYADTEGVNVCEDTAWLSKIGTGHFCKLQRLNLAKKRTVYKEETVPVETVESVRETCVDSSLENGATALVKCLEKLDDESRHIVIRRFYDGASFKQIAAELNTTPYGAKVMIEEAILVLRQELSNEGIVIDG